MDKILIPDLPILCRVGVPEAERAVEQELFVDLELEVDLEPAGRDDDFRRTVDYVAVCVLVEATVSERPRSLIETVAEDVARDLLKAFPVEAVVVRIKKPAALQGRGVPYAAVEIRRTRRAATS